jgi:ABC-2 type transport system ATP-binding protein
MSDAATRQARTPVAGPAASRVAAVEADGVARHYGSLVAVDDLSFAVEAGEILGVLGPNGAGKTSAIRVLTTILPPTRGRFTVAGVPHTRPAEIRRRVGVLPESAGYPERETGAEYLRYFARLYGAGRSAAQASAADLLARVGLAERADSLIATYSRGMRQRLGIARALVNEPQVVFLDEPTLGLDPAGQREVLALVRRIALERGTTVLLSTHLLAEVEETCSRVLILNRGRVVADGTVAEVARMAAAPRSVRLRVAPEHLERAHAALAATEEVEHVEAVNGRPGALALQLRRDLPEQAANAALRALANAGVAVLAYEVEGARLSDAFLAMTGGT